MQVRRFPPVCPLSVERIFVSRSDIALDSSQFSTRIVDKFARDHLDTPSRKALTGLHERMGGGALRLELLCDASGD